MADERPISRMDRRDFLRLAGLVSAAGLIDAAASAKPALGQSIEQGLPPRNFAQPDRLRYNSQCLYVENKPFLMYSGSFHFSRCPKPLWSARFEKIKEAGFNTVETYVMWNYHEPAMPQSLDDFSGVDLTDLNDWLKMAEEFGFYIVIRPGPYVCSEWDAGGFPQWLMSKKPAGYQGDRYKGMWLRTDDPTFVDWSLHWYQAVCPVVAPHQITRKNPGEPGVILFQVENEYDFVWQVPDAAKANYTRALVQEALADGIEVPLFINWGKFVVDSKDPMLRQVFDTMDEYPHFKVQDSANDAHKLRAQQHDAPLMIAELQGGWFNSVNGPPGIRTDEDYYAAGIGPTQINNLTLLCLQSGVTLMNYYMLFGGTNMAAWAAHNIATSYDYSAAIRECGGVGDKFLRVKAIAAMIKEHGPALAQSSAVSTREQAAQGDVKIAARQAPDGSSYVFVRTTQHFAARNGAASVGVGGGPTITFNYDLEPFGSKILYLPAGATSADQGRWLPEAQTGPTRPANLPDAVVLAEVRSQPDAAPDAWRQSPATLADLGNYAGGFSYYRFSADGLPASPSTALTVKQLTAGGVTALWNNNILFAKKDGVTPAILPLPANANLAQANQILLIYEDQGHPNGGTEIGNLYGISDVGYQPSTGRPIRELFSLDFGGGPTGLAKGWQNPEFDDASWTKQTLPQSSATGVAAALLTWHRMTFTLPALDAGVWVPWCLRLAALGNGFIYLNGHNIGRYWQNGGQREFFLPDCWLNTGPNNSNVIALCLRGIDKPSGVQMAQVVPYTVYAEVRST
jgi:Glycosyl hydrolases family 35